MDDPGLESLEFSSSSYFSIQMKLPFVFFKKKKMYAQILAINDGTPLSAVVPFLDYFRDYLL